MPLTLIKYSTHSPTAASYAQAHGIPYHGHSRAVGMLAEPADVEDWCTKILLMDREYGATGKIHAVVPGVKKKEVQ